jgi:hypothetical protein
VNSEDPEPPDTRVTLFGLSDQETPDGLVEFVRVTVPAKPFKLARFMVVEPDDPTFTWIEFADEMLKSTIFTVIAVIWVNEPLVAVTVTK